MRAVKRIVLCGFVLLCTFLSAKAQIRNSRLAAEKSFKSGNGFKKITLAKALSLIEKKYDVSLLYSNKLVRNKTVLEKDLSGPFKDELTSILIPFNLSYSKLNTRSYTIVPVIPQTNRLVKIVAQDSVRGKVIDARTEKALPGVNILIQGTTEGTATDADGEYSLAHPSKTDTLIFSYIGYNTQRVPILGREEINVRLEPATMEGNEVVVVGYGEQRQEDLTASISHVSSDQLQEKTVLNVGQALQGQVAGAQVIQQGGGKPGGNPMIRIRGTNSINTSSDPLFVVDGVVGVSNALTTLNPQDISSIEVLKDASATAIYGSRGANGVIIITTKRGQSGKTQVEYNGSLSVGNLQRHLYALNSDQLMYVYMQSMNNGDKYGTINRNKDFRACCATGNTFSEMPWLFKQVSGQNGYFLDLMGADGNYYAPRFKSNWEQKMFDNHPVSNDQHLQIRGGNEKSTYSIALGYSNDQGLMLQSWYKRYNVRLTGSTKITDWLDVQSQVNFNKNKSTDDGGITRSTTEVWPIVPVKYPNDPSTFGSYAGRWGTNADFPVGEQWYNVIFRRSQILGRDNNSGVRGSVVFNADISDKLTFKTNFSSEFNASKNNYYSGKLYGGDGYASINNSNSLYWQSENYFNYDNTFGDDHHITGLLGFSWSQNSWQNFGGNNSVFFNNFYQWHNIGVGAASRPGINSGDGSSELNSYFARLHYSYKGKYLLTLTGRVDGSSKFGKNKKYGLFPSAGLAWNIAREHFMRNLDFISNLKLRTTAGITGNQEIGSYVTQAYVGANSSIIRGNGTVTGLYPSTLGNPDLKWEQTEQYDAGLNIGLWNSRLNLEIDYYYKKTTDMLLSVPLPESSTSGSSIQNFGAVQNQGWEFTLNTRNIQTNNINWSTSINAASNQNKVLKLGPNGAPIYTASGQGYPTSVIMEGQPIGSFFGLTRLGTWNTNEVSEAARYGLKPGDLKFEDKNNDGQINQFTDGGVIGHGFPRWTINVKNNFNYKNLDASLNIRIVEGVNKFFVHESAEDRQLVSGGLNTQLNAWRPNHQNTMIAQMRPGNAGAYYLSEGGDTHSIYDGSFIKGAAATIGYTLSQDMVGNIGAQTIRIYARAQNFFVITKAFGYNVEGSSLDQTRSLSPNEDKYQYPRPAVYTVGININF